MGGMRIRLWHHQTCASQPKSFQDKNTFYIRLQVKSNRDRSKGPSFLEKDICGVLRFVVGDDNIIFSLSHVFRGIRSVAAAWISPNVVIFSETTEVVIYSGFCCSLLEGK